MWRETIIDICVIVDRGRVEIVMRRGGGVFTDLICVWAW